MEDLNTCLVKMMNVEHRSCLAEAQCQVRMAFSYHNEYCEIGEQPSIMIAVIITMEARSTSHLELHSGLASGLELHKRTSCLEHHSDLTGRTESS